MTPIVGVAVLVFHQGKILLGKRLASHGENLFAPPGGHLEFGETPIECAKRELFEETALTALTLEEGPWISTFFENKHYVTLFIKVYAFEGELSLKEPTKCESWNWFEKEKLPRPFFYPFEHFLEKYQL
jgi:8-oxo-dGTP diphosphatase